MFTVEAVTLGSSKRRTEEKMSSSHLHNKTKWFFEQLKEEPSLNNNNVVCSLRRFFNTVNCALCMSKLVLGIIQDQVQLNKESVFCLVRIA